MLAKLGEFVPAADEVGRLQRGEDRECRFFQGFAEEGHYVAVRPSGTEPKVKFYLFTFVPAEQLHLLDEARQEMDARLAAIEGDLRAIAGSM